MNIFFILTAKPFSFSITSSEFNTDSPKPINSFFKVNIATVSFFSKECCSDGRNSLEYMNLIKTIYDINSKLDLDIKIFCVSPSQAKNQEEAEKGLASNILKTTDNKKTFAVVGNIHASKKEIDFFKQKIVPAGFLLHKELGDNMYSILITAKKGEIFNNGLRKIKSSKNDPFETNFDYVIRLEKVTHCSFL